MGARPLGGSHLSLGMADRIVIGHRLVVCSPRKAYLPTLQQYLHSVSVELVKGEAVKAGIVAMVRASSGE